MWFTISSSISNLLTWFLLQHFMAKINNLVLYTMFHYSTYCICYMLQSVRLLADFWSAILQTEACSICNTLFNETLYTKLNYLSSPWYIEAKNMSKDWKLIKIWLTIFRPILLDSIQLNWQFAINQWKMILFQCLFY